MKLFYGRKRDKKIGQKSGTCANVVNIINISSNGFYLTNLNICPRILLNLITVLIILLVKYHLQIIFIFENQKR